MQAKTRKKGTSKRPTQRVKPTPYVPDEENYDSNRSNPNSAYHYSPNKTRSTDRKSAKKVILDNNPDAAQYDFARPGEREKKEPAPAEKPKTQEEEEEEKKTHLYLDDQQAEKRVQVLKEIILVREQKEFDRTLKQY